MNKLEDPKEYIITLAELKAELAKIEDDSVYVVLAKDGEGNDFSPLVKDGFKSSGYYLRHSNWSGDVYSAQDMEEEDYDIDDDEVIEVIVLWPCN